MLATYLRGATAAVKSPEVISSSIASNSNSGTLLSVPAPSGIQEGDLLVAFLYAPATGSGYWNVGADWNEQLDQVGLAVQIKIATSAEPETYSFSTNTTVASRQAIIVCVRGGNYQGSGNLVTTLSGTTNVVAPSMSVNKNSLLFAIYYVRSSATVNAGTPTGFSLVARNTIGSGRVHLFSRAPMPAGESGTVTSSWNLSTTRYGRLISINPA